LIHTRLREKTAIKQNLKARSVSASALGRGFRRDDAGGAGLRLQRQTLIIDDGHDLTAPDGVAFANE
jgi:hypothetical protein